MRPEQGLLQLRKALGLFANLRPVVPHPAVLDASPIKAELLRGVDIMVVRELTGGIYFGEKHRTATEAIDLCRYTRAPRSNAWCGSPAQLARTRRRKLTSVDKANVLETSRLWRSVVERMLPAEFPDVSFEHMLVDAAAMHLLRRPRDFDVIVTENMFGDILTDEASMLAGSMGLLPSASLGDAGARRTVRTDPRLRTGHRRPRHRQSLCGNLERRACCCAIRCGSKPKRVRWKRRSRARSTRACCPRTSPRRRQAGYDACRRRCGAGDTLATA